VELYLRPGLKTSRQPRTGVALSLKQEAVESLLVALRISGGLGRLDVMH
jgi:hypothetical protein